MAIKIFRCPCCKDEKEADLNVVMKICYGCQVEMISRLEGLKEEKKDGTN